MNKKIILFLLFIFLGINTVFGQTTTWTKLANHTDVDANGTYMIVDVTSSNALTSQYGVATPQVVGVTITNNGSTITGTIANALQWTFTASGSNYIIKPKGLTTMLYSTTANDGVRVGTTNNTWTLNQTSGSYKGFKNVNQNRYIGVYGDQDWRTYTTFHANIAATKIEIFKLEEDLYWDASGGLSNGVGGSATWTNQTDTRFSTANTGSATLVAAAATANIIFEGSPGTVTFGGSPAATASTFNVDGYTIATSGSGTRTLAGLVKLTSKNITFAPIAAAGLTLSGVISGTGTATSTIVTKNGAGTLTLSSAGNTFTGKILINEGFIAASGESLFGANPSSFTADQITLNGGGIASTGSSSINFSSNRGILLGSDGGKFDVVGSNATITLTNVVSGTGSLTKQGPGILLMANNHTYTGSTILNAGTLRLSAANRISDASDIVLNGGTFSTGASTGFSETVNTLNLNANANATITLGTGNHTLRFANSSGINWSGSSLTINGWTGTGNASGTGGKIFIGTSDAGITSSQLAKINFSGFLYGTTILPTGEIVPALNTAPYFEIENISGAFGSACVGTTAGTTGKFDLYGYNLTGDVTIGPLAGFSFSNDGITFTSDLTLTPTGGELLEEIRIRFSPVAAQSYNGSIAIAGGGVTTPSTVSVTATGVANVTPTVSIALTTGANPRCGTVSTIFTATPATLSGGIAVYQWKLNGSNVGTNSTTYSNASLADGDIVSCSITITGGNCLTSNTANSNAITMIINAIPATPDSASILGDRTGCGSVELTKSNAEWYWQTSATGTATGTLNSNATYTATSSTTVYIRAKSASDCWSTALSIPVVVRTPVSITTDVSAISKATCLGGTNFTALSVAASGSGLSYQWYSNTIASTDIATSTPVGTNSNSFTPLNTTVGTLHYYVVVSGTAPCTPVVSNIAEHTVNPVAAISAVIPSSGAPVGTLVTITGSGFTSGSTVKFGTIAATDVTIVSATEIQAVVPDGADQNLVTVTTALSCPSSKSYTVINQNATGCN